MTPLETYLAQRTLRGGGPSVRTDAGGNPQFTPGEMACFDVQRAMAERKPREVEVVNLDFRKGTWK